MCALFVTVWPQTFVSHRTAIIKNIKKEGKKNRQRVAQKLKDWRTTKDWRSGELEKTRLRAEESEMREVRVFCLLNHCLCVARVRATCSTSSTPSTSRSPCATATVATWFDLRLPMLYDWVGHILWDKMHKCVFILLGIGIGIEIGMPPSF